MSVDACESCRDAVIAAACQVVDFANSAGDAIDKGATTAELTVPVGIGLHLELERAVEQMRRCRTGEHQVAEFDSQMEGVRMVREAMRRHGFA